MTGKDKHYEQLWVVLVDVKDDIINAEESTVAGD